MSGAPDLPPPGLSPPGLSPDALRRLLEEASPDQLSAILLALSAERPEILGPLLDRLKAMKRGG